MAIEIIEKIQANGYHVTSQVKIGLIGLLGQKDGVRAVLLTGLPGVGKTSLPRELAKALNIPSDRVIEYIFHDWSNADELFAGINVKEVVRGNPNGVEKMGALALAAEKSHEGETILILDELDKSRDFVENILLQFLQDGLVQGVDREGKTLRANLSNLLVFITSNGTRTHGDALLRRLMRLDVPVLPIEIVHDLVSRWSGAPKGVVTTAITAANKIANGESSHVSPQEIHRLVNHLAELKKVDLVSKESVRQTLEMWARKSTTPVDKNAGTSLLGELRSAALWTKPQSLSVAA